MRHFLIAAFVLLCLDREVGASPMFALPKGAVDAGHVILQPGVGEQDYFWFNEKYPGTSAMDHYRKLFSKWRPCRGWDQEWSFYADHTDGKKTFVHQLVRHWTNPSNDIAVTIAIKYDSSGVAYRTAPDNERQYVAVIRHKVPDAAKHLMDIGVRCEKGT